MTHILGTEMAACGKFPPWPVGSMLSLQDEIVQVHSYWKHQRKRESVIINLTGKSLADSLCICKACITQVKRNVNSDTTFHPRWLPRQANPVEVCFIKSCKHLAYRKTNFVSPQQLENALDRQVGMAHRYLCATPTILSCITEPNSQIPVLL